MHQSDLLSPRCGTETYCVYLSITELIYSEDLNLVFTDETFRSNASTQYKVLSVCLDCALSPSSSPSCTFFEKNYFDSFQISDVFSVF